MIAIKDIINTVKETKEAQVKLGKLLVANKEQLETMPQEKLQDLVSFIKKQSGLADGYKNSINVGSLELSSLDAERASVVSSPIKSSPASVASTPPSPSLARTSSSGSSDSDNDEPGAPRSSSSDEEKHNSKPKPRPSWAVQFQGAPSNPVAIPPPSPQQTAARRRF